MLTCLACFLAFPTVQKQLQATKAPTLRYGYVAPTVESPGAVQLSEYNTFVNNKNVVELYNTKNTKVVATLDILSHDGRHLFDVKATLPPKGSTRVPLKVAPNTYGLIIINGDGVVFRNYVSREGEYVLPFLGQ